jgi:hypothetical protein
MEAKNVVPKATNDSLILFFNHLNVIIIYSLNDFSCVYFTTDRLYSRVCAVIIIIIIIIIIFIIIGVLHVTILNILCYTKIG